MDKGRLHGLDGLRGLMAWWVVAGHIGHTFGSENPVLASNGLAVDVFIILSGFVIAKLIEEQREDYATFITRRALRLFPLYLAVLFASALLLPLIYEVLVTFPENARNHAREIVTVEGLANLPLHLAAHIPLLQGLVPHSVLEYSAYTIVGQAWSVSLEWQFYLVAPLVMGALATRRYVLLGAFCAVLMALSLHMGPAFLGSKLALFAVGIGSYRYPRLLLLAVPLALWADGIAVFVPLAIWAAALPFANSALMGAAPLRYLGDRSYSVYLVHMLPLYVGGWFTRDALVLSAIVVFGTLALSHFTYRFIELPGIALGKRLTRRMHERRALLEVAA
ncbi:acyltransferase [Qipengyuania sp. 1NDH17]|uniref:Acyltransferase n=1 Tax=Qipengyuania polymorpha TaxID=2867234 RepID=A0ABS7IUA6_9SPHN|nr:acyltransferase [Qipengyuania polymorpha]MBX7456748.1 acyltransferase [Qipengyuania polymorpha]